MGAIEWGPELGQHPMVTDSYKREVEAASVILSKAHQEGVMLMAGTDSGQVAVPYGAWHAREMEHMMHYLGMNNIEAIRAGTYNAAFALGMQDQIGTLEEGKLADILVVDGDPLADIQVLQDPERLEVIMKDGEIVDTTTPLPTFRSDSGSRPGLYAAPPAQSQARVPNSHELSLIPARLTKSREFSGRPMRGNSRIEGTRPVRSGLPPPPSSPADLDREETRVGFPRSFRGFTGVCATRDAHDVRNEPHFRARSRRSISGGSVCADSFLGSVPFTLQWPPMAVWAHYIHYFRRARGG